MSTPRGLANQKLYHARILANSWRSELARESVPATVLAGAFDPPAREHLRAAYGWFLVEITRPAVVPATPPGSTVGLPEIAGGEAVPGEIRELRQLEQSGWIADMLGEGASDAVPAKAAQSLAIPVSQTPSPDQIDTWIEKLQHTFDRMADSLDEY